MRCLFLTTLLLFILFITTQATYLTFQIEPRKRRCFYEEINTNQEFSLYFEVIRGGLLDIKFQFSNPSRHNVVDRVAFFNKPSEEANLKEGTFQYTAKSGGIYSFCFDNTASRWTTKMVSFEVRSTRANKKSAAKLEDLGPMVDSVISMSGDLDTVEQSHRINRRREQQHIFTAKALNSRLQWFTIISTIVLVGLTWLSISSIQKWFQTDARRDGFNI